MIPWDSLPFRSKVKVIYLVIKISLLRRFV